MVNTKRLGCLLMIAVVLSCGNSGNRAASYSTGGAADNLSSSNARKITLKDSQVRSYLTAIKSLAESSPELVEKIQAQVPVDLSEHTGAITGSGFKNEQEFKNTSLVVSICMGVITSAENLDRIQSMTKEDYLSEFTADLDADDEFDQLIREKVEEQLNTSFAELESQGLVGQNTNNTARFVRLLKEKVGEKNTELVLKYLGELKAVWAYKY